MKHGIWKILIAALATIITAPAGAQSQSLETVESKPRTEVTISPRTAYYFDDYSSSGFYILPPGAVRQNESVESPRGPLRAALFGANVSVVPASIPRLTLTIGALYGKRKGITVDGLVVDPRAGSTLGSGLYFGRQLAKLNYSRLDVEGTAQYRLNDFVALLAGVRYERGRVNFRACFENYESADPNVKFPVPSNANQAPNATLTFDQATEVCRQILASGSVADFASTMTLNQLQTAVGRPVLPAVTAGRDTPTNIFFQSFPRGHDGYDIFTARVGAAVSVPLSESGRSRVYANGFLVGGHRHVIGENQRRFDNAVVAGPDLAIGFAYSLTTHLSLDVRYRASFLFPLTGPRNVADPRASHGAILSVSYRL